MFAASLFALEAGATAYVYSASLSSNFSFVASTDLFGAFWVGLGLTLTAVGLSIYMLFAAGKRLEARLLARWTAQDCIRSAERPAAANGRPRDGWASDVALAMFGVVFFAESATLALTLALSASSGFFINMSTDSVGEFWVEYPLVLAGVALALYILGRSVGRLARGLSYPRVAASNRSTASFRSCLPENRARLIPPKF